MNDLNQTFDVSRAVLSDSPRFQPFYVKKTQLLQKAITDGVIAADKHLLVVAGTNGVVALDIVQMSYHHVAQGKMAGEPWLVTF